MLKQSLFFYLQSVTFPFSRGLRKLSSLSEICVWKCEKTACVCGTKGKRKSTSVLLRCTHGFEERVSVCVWEEKHLLIYTYLNQLASLVLFYEISHSNFQGFNTPNELQRQQNKSILWCHIRTLIWCFKRLLTRPLMFLLTAVTSEADESVTGLMDGRYYHHIDVTRLFTAQRR